MTSRQNESLRRRKALEKQRNQNRKDIELSRLEVAGFDWRTCEAFRLLCEFFGNNKIRTEEIRPVAQVCADQYDIPFPREPQRRKPNLLKWCNDNIVVLEQLLGRIRIEYNTGDVISMYSPCLEKTGA